MRSGGHCFEFVIHLTSHELIKCSTCAIWNIKHLFTWFIYRDTFWVSILFFLLKKIIQIKWNGMTETVRKWYNEEFLLFVIRFKKITGRKNSSIPREFYTNVTEIRWKLLEEFSYYFSNSQFIIINSHRIFHFIYATTEQHDNWFH